MVFLLTQHAIFLKLQNNCYIQLTGLAINKLPISQDLSSFKPIESSEPQKKYSITIQETSSKTIKYSNENVEKLTSKVVILNNHSIIKVVNTNFISNLCFSQSV